MSQNEVEQIEVSMAESAIVEIGTITPYWRNPRKNADAVAVVKESIKQYGFNVPIMLDEEGVIITGHTRYKAMKELGATHILTVVNKTIDKKLADEYRIADNAAGNVATWDMELLPIEMRDMRIDTMQSFFPAIDITSMMDQIKGSIKTTIVSPDAMVKTKVDLNGTFEERSKQQTEDLVEVTCPHCADDFFISQSILQSQLKVQADDKAADERNEDAEDK